MMFHSWISSDDGSACLACGLTVDDGYLFREDLERKLVIGLSVSLPNCQPAIPSCAVHHIQADGTCYHCNATEPQTSTCEGHETCMYCMDVEPSPDGPVVTLRRNAGSITAFWTDDQDHLQHRQYVYDTQQEVVYEVRQDLRPRVITWE